MSVYHDRKDALEEFVHSSLIAYRTNHDETKAESAIHFLRLAEGLGVSLDLWRLQNLFWVLSGEHRGTRERSQQAMRELADKLSFR